MVKAEVCDKATYGLFNVALGYRNVVVVQMMELSARG